MTHALSVSIGAILLSIATPAFAGEEIQVLHGDRAVPGFAGGGREAVTTATLQVAEGWEYGDIFGFADVTTSGEENGFADLDLYTELNLRVSASKVTGQEIGFGPVRDIGVIGAVNYAADAKVVKFLPGVTMSLDVPGFAFFVVDVMAYIDASEGVAAGGAPKESDTWTVNTSWLVPFQIGGEHFTIQGYGEYLAPRTNEFGDRLPAHVLIEPQIRWEVSDRVAIGTELTFWSNKLGDRDTDEKAAQLLVALKF